MEIELVEVLRLFIYFFIYSIFGWVLESVYKTIYEKKWVNSGFLHGPLCPIYGTGAIMMILFLSSFKNNIFLLFLVGFVVLSIWEYFVGWLLEKLFNTKYWDYTKNKFNIKGRVCLYNSIIWGLLGTIFVRLIHPIIENKIVLLDNDILFYIDLILIILMIIDTVISIIKVTSINKAIDKFKDIGENLKERLEELKDLNIKQELNAQKLKQATLEKIENVKDEIGEKLEDVKEGLEEKIKGIEKSIDELKLKQDAINMDFYSKAKRLKKAFPTMKSEKMSIFVNQKVDEKRLKQEKIKKRKIVNKQKK